MKKLFVLIFSIAILSQVYGQDQERAKACFAQAKNEITSMLEGKSPLSFEKAIFLMENAYYNNEYAYEDFKTILDIYIHQIIHLTSSAKDLDRITATQRYVDTPEQCEERYEQAKDNHAIFSFITDTTYTFWLTDTCYNHFFVQQRFPFMYPTSDPLGSNDWTNTQVLNLMLNKTGNCFAQSTLFKILADRLHTGAQMCTAPGHIYIRHADENGTLYNVELATASFPGTGSLKTLTYTTTQAIKSGIALRQLNYKQSVALCLVYLAKGYQHQVGVAGDDFMMDCAETALHFDSLNLNALLLKRELLEQRLVSQGKNLADLRTREGFKTYEALVNQLYLLGYREMPVEMKNMIVSSLIKDSVSLQVQDHTPVAFEGIKYKTQYASLSWGLFEEMQTTKPVEQYGRTLYDTKTKRVTGFKKADTLYNHYNFDPVAFAWNIDPLAAKYPDLSPYSAFANNPIYFIDADGREPTKANMVNLSEYIKILRNHNVKTLDDLKDLHGKGSLGSHWNDGHAARYMYSTKWGWIDMSHFSSGAYFTDRWYLTQTGVLANMEGHENEDYKTNPSSFDYEDLVSNLLGVYFEDYLESDKAQNKDLVTNLSEYLTDLGFVNDVSVAPNIESLPENHHVKTNNPKNYTYTPMYTTEKREGKLDKEIISLKNTFLEIMKVFGYGGEDRRTEDNKNQSKN